MLILGFDPGTTLIGFGLIDKDRQKLKAIDYGCINTATCASQDKLSQLEKQVVALISKHRPDFISIEKLFFSKNVKTAMSVSEARGVIALCAQKNRRPIFEYTPLQIKQAVVGYGQASKKQVQQMVKIILKLKEVPTPDDTADALAAAICCAHSERF